MHNNPGTPLPWGLSRMAPYPPTAPAPYIRGVLDPETQTGRYLDKDGLPVTEMGKHGTSKKTTDKTVPGGPDGAGGQPPQPGKPDSVPDTTTD